MIHRPLTRLLAVLALVLCAAVPARAQRVVREPNQSISLAKGASALLVNPVNYQRWAVGDPSVAEVVTVSANELLVNAKDVGSTSIFVWDGSGTPRLYAVQVTADAAGLQRYLKQLMPDEDIAVSASGKTVTLSGTVKDPNTVDRAVEVAKTTGAEVIDNLIAPPAVQVLLRVRIAEVGQSAAREFSSALQSLNPHKLDDDGDWLGRTVSDGLLRLFLSNPNANLDVVIQAANSKGDFKTLAEPNLLTLPGREAYFLAGGEFPFPTLQGGNNANAVTIVFKEFGVKLRFTPTIARNGAIRLKVEPEVSALDFANGLVISGFEIPTLLTRRTETEVELGEGQWLALSGLIDYETVKNVTKIPVLGDIPILGQFFRSSSARERRSELLVLVTPTLVRAGEQAPPVPTGEPETWNRFAPKK